MTLKWMLHQITHRKGTYILLGILLICYLVTGGLTRSYSENGDLMTLNVAFATNFDTIDAWQNWHTRWQFTWLVSAINMTGLLPLLVNIIPHSNTSELTVPIVMGQSRRSVFFAQLICYDLAAVVLWLGYLALGYLWGRIPLRPLFPVSYYFRTIGYALLLQLGYANLALTLVQLFRNRTLGIIVGIVFLVNMSILKNIGKLWNIFSVISYASRDRDQLWMWAMDSQPTFRQWITLILFPVVTTALSCLTGLIRMRRRDLA